MSGKGNGVKMAVNANQDNMVGIVDLQTAAEGLCSERG
jgi:hypothetical protein